MIDIYFWRTPNCSKITIFCEEAGLPYRIIPIDIGKGEQRRPEYRKICPNGKVPTIVDHASSYGMPLTLFESGAILLYLASKAEQFLPADPVQRWNVVQWLMFQMGGVGPMLGQTHHFRLYAPEKLDYAIDRYTNEAGRLYGVLEGVLARTEYVAGPYSIADMAILPWIVPYRRQGQDLDKFPNLRRWFDQVRKRPAVTRGLNVGKELFSGDSTKLDDQARAALFGPTD